MIDVKNLKFKYSSKDQSWLLKDISFTLNRGERVALMGANGSGKTTFVRCLNGLLDISEGDIHINGLDIKDDEKRYEIRRMVGMVFQNPENQIVSTTVEREIAFGLENLGIPYQIIREKVEKTLIEFNLARYRKTSPHLLSGGEKQRLAFASVWVMEPEYLILDETTSMLDYSLREQLYGFIDLAVSEKKIGILFVTQFPEDILNFERLIILNNGKFTIQGKPDEVFSNERELKKIGIPLPAEYELVNYIKRKL